MAHTSWRLFITASQAGGNIAVGEIEMRATFAGADQCAGGTVIKSAEQGGFPATNAFDNTAAAWAANAVPAWIGYTFAAPVEVFEIAITSWTDATFWSLAPKDFRVECSNDGFATESTVAFTFTGVTWSGPGVTKLFAVGSTGLETAKTQTYGLLGAPQLVHTTKGQTYSVLGPPLLVTCTKKVMYVITGPDDGTRQRVKVRYVRSHR